jgi:hypothetical protein
MAAGLGFKTFDTGDVLSAADTNGYLMQGVLVFADSTARAAAITSPQEGQFSFLKDTNSTEYYTGSAWAAVGGGGGGGGKVLQVVTATNATAVNTSSTSYSTTGLSAAITPSAATSKVAIFVHTAAAIQAADRRGIFTIFRGTTAGTDLSSNTSYGMNNASTGSGDSSSIYPLSMNYLDSPSTTSSQTYTVALKSDGGGQIGSSQVTSVIILMEIGA